MLDVEDINLLVEEDKANLFNPFRPLPQGAGRLQPVQNLARKSQRERRANILAITRRLLTERGCEGVTVREVVLESGYALQTIYNLVGPRNRLITDAISEYSLFVGRIATRGRDPSAMVNLCDTWMEAVEASPEFARQTNLIMFSSCRDVYYHFRDIQIRGMAHLLREGQANGSLRLRNSPRKVAEQLVFYSTAIWIEWADRPFPLPVLKERLLTGLLKLLRD